MEKVVYGLPFTAIVLLWGWLWQIWAFNALAGIVSLLGMKNGFTTSLSVKRFPLGVEPRAWSVALLLQLWRGYRVRMFRAIACSER